MDQRSIRQLESYFLTRAKDNVIMGDFTPDVDRSYNIGSPTRYLNNIYVDTITADVLTGTIVGNEWEGTTNMTIDVNVAAESYLMVRNENAGGEAGLRVERDLMVGTIGAGPGGTIHAQTASATVSPDANADEIVAENDVNAGISILGANSGEFRLLMGSISGAAHHGLIGYGSAHATLADQMDMVVDGASRIRFHNAGFNFLQTSTIGSPSGDLILEANTQVKVNDPLFVGGTLTPDGILHVYSGSAGAVTASTSADEIVAEASGTGGISILTPDATIGNLYFGRESDNDAGRITYDHNNTRFGFSVEGVEGLRLSNNLLTFVSAGQIDTTGSLTLNPSTDLILSATNFIRSTDTGSMVVSGGNSGTSGGIVQLFGGTHATLASQTIFYRDAVEVGRFDAAGDFLLPDTLNFTNNAIIGVQGGNSLFISPTGDAIFNPGGNDVYPFVNYDNNLGLINKKWLTLHAAELWVDTLVAQDVIATIGGRIIVAPTTKLVVDFPLSYFTDATNGIDFNENGASADTVVRQDGGSWIDDGFQVGEFIQIVNTPDPGKYELFGVTASTLTLSIGSFTTTSDNDTDAIVYVTTAKMEVEHNSLLAGDRLLMQKDGKIEFFSVVSGPTASGSHWVYLVDRDLDGTGLNTWYAGDAVVNTGQTGSGFIEIYSQDSVNGRFFDHIYVDDGGVFSSNLNQSANYKLFPTAAFTGDNLYIGMEDTTFSNAYFFVSVVGSFTNSITWEYYDGSWGTLTTSAVPDFEVAGVQDLLFSSSQSGWTKTTINGVNAYWIRARVGIGTWTTTPEQGSRRVHGERAHFGPTIVGNIRQSGTFNDWVEGWAIGNLNGLYGVADDVYGIGLGEKNGTDPYVRITGTGIEFFRGSGARVGFWQGGGDFVLGEVVTNSANLLWDQSEGELVFRGGSNGTTAGVVINTLAGITFPAVDAVPTNRVSINWENVSGDVTTRIYDRLLSGQSLFVLEVTGEPSSNSASLSLKAIGSGSSGIGEADILMTAQATAGGNVIIQTGDNSTASDGFTVQNINVSPTRYIQAYMGTGQKSVFMNPDGADIDFRVESAANVNAINLDANNERLGFFRAPTTHAVEVGGDLYVTGDIFTTQWTDYTSSSTKTGWSSFTTQNIRYKRVGNLIFVNFILSGTSNSTAASFTLPVATASSGGVQNPIRSINNGAVVTGMMIISASSSTVNMYTNYNTAAWTASGSKTCAGQFFYRVT